MVRRTIIVITLVLLAWAGGVINATMSREEDAQRKRNLIICFEIKDYNARIRESIEWIFNDLIRTGDNLIVYSPARVYGFSQKTLSRPKAQLSEWLRERFKADTSIAASGYQQVFNELKGLVREMLENRSDVKSILNRYKQGLASLTAQRRINQTLLLKFAEMFRKTPGDNHILLFYEKEMRPIPDSSLMDTLMQNPDLSFTAAEVFMQPHQEDDSLNCQSVIDAYGQVGARFHFAYLKTGRQRAPRRMNLHEHSTDMYAYFSRLAKKTGGLMINSSNPMAVMKEFSGMLEKGVAN